MKLALTVALMIGMVVWYLILRATFREPSFDRVVVLLVLAAGIVYALGELGRMIP